jgi:hypothetical protein
MKSMKKTTYLVAITLVIAGLVISSAASMPISKGQTNSIKVERSNKVAQSLSAPTMHMSIPNKQVPSTLDTTPAIEASGDQIHPTFGRSVSGIHMAAYKDVDTSNIIWTYSDDNGATYDPGIYYEGLGGDYPSFKLWGDERFFGTYVTDYNDLNGGLTYLYEVNDATQLDETTLNPLTYWDWSTYGWYDMIDADIACDNSENTFEWGISSYVISTTYASSPYIYGPTIVYSDETTAGSGWISWYNYNGCGHTDVEIDQTTHYGYCVYDWFNASSWKLLARVIDFATVQTGFDTMYQITGTGNLEYPAVAASNDKVVILAQTDENGNDDIICLYSDNKMVTVSQSFVADSVDNEMFPDVRVDGDGNFVCTFVKDDTLYTSTSDDSGATWSTPESVDSCVSEYKSADITDLGVQALFEKSNGADIDIWLTPLASEPQIPIIKVMSIAGGLGVSAVIKNDGTADATNVDWTIHVTGGILGKINKTATGTIASLAMGAEQTVKTGILFGFGAISITVTADTDSMTAAGKQLIIYTKV